MGSWHLLAAPHARPCIVGWGEVAEWSVVAACYHGLSQLINFLAGFDWLFPVIATIYTRTINSNGIQTEVQN
jgi:hypothetical protein